MDRTISIKTQSLVRPKQDGTRRICPACLQAIPIDAHACPSCERPVSRALGVLDDSPTSSRSDRIGPVAENEVLRSLSRRYEVLDLLGEGGMGTVYRARDLRLDREIALKLLVSSDETLAVMFEQEARILASFEHDHIVRIYDFGRADDVPYLTMEYIRGCSLATRLSERRLTLVESVRTTIDVLKGVAEAHRRGIVHRDLKPANVFIDESGRVKVADFGMALRFVFDGSQRSGTEHETIVGTPGYMAPEIRRGSPAGPPTDTYAVGVMLHEMLTGQRLDDVEDLSVYLCEPPSLPCAPSTVNPSVPRSLDAIVLRAIDPDPMTRPDASSLMAMLVEWLEHAHKPVRGPESRGLPPHPFKLLSHYGSSDREIFFGRDAEICELIEIIENSPVRLLFVFGPCGIGKSSLIHAGVIPSLDYSRFDPVTLVSGQDPSRTLLEGMAARIQAAGLPIPDRGVPVPRMLEASPRLLVDLLQAWGRATNKTMIVLLDQLEELFTHNLRGSPNVAEFFRIVEIVVGTQTVPVKLLLSFRTEFRGALYLLEEKLRRHQRSVAVREIGLAGLIEVIEGPSRMATYGFQYQEGFASHLAAEVLRTTCGAGEAVLPVLQIVCRQLYDQMKRSASNIIGWDLYKHALGGVSQALTRYVEERLEAPTYAHRGAIARQMLKALTVKEGGERFARAREEEELLGFPDRNAAERTLEQLVSDHLVVREESADGGRRVRLASEVICPLVDGWTIEVGELDRAARTLSKAFRQWSEGGRRPEDLLSGSALGLVAQHLVAMNGRTEAEHRFVAASITRRNRRKMMAVAMCSLIVFVVGCLAYAAYLKPGIVELDSEPRHARVHLGGTFLGETPFSWRARPGTYSLELSRGQYDPTRIDVRVPAGGSVFYRPVLRYPFGILAVGSIPSGIECEIRPVEEPSRQKPSVDPKKREATTKPLLTKKTPFTTEFPAGTYRLKASQAGYVTTSPQPFTMGANRELCHLTVTLAQDIGSLSVWTPANSKMTIRRANTGESVWTGRIPRTGPLPIMTGQYHIECESQWGSQCVTSVTITRGTTTACSMWPDLPYPLWMARLGDAVQTSPALADLNKDGTLDVVAGLVNQNVVALSGASGQGLWTYETRGRIQSSPALGDLDSDGVMDVVIGSNDWKVHAISGKNARSLWKFETRAAVVSSPAVADLDRDGVPDAVIGSNDHNVYALSGRTGKPLWTYATGGEVTSSPTLFDLNHDGVPDVVIGSDDRRVHAISGATGSRLFTVETKAAVHSSAAVADIDQDTRPEIVIGSKDRSLYVIDGSKGRTKWTFATGGEVNSSPALNDLDSDGFLDIVVGSGDSRVYAISGRKKTPLWTYKANDKVNGSPVVGDLNGDGVGDVFIGANDSLTHVIDGRSGTRLFALPEGCGPAAVALGDFTGDGVLDFVGGSYTKPYAKAGSIIPQRALWSFGTLRNDKIPPSVTDLDSDGYPDVFVASPEGRFVGLSGRTGRPLWDIRSNPTLMMSPTLVDLDKDHTRDIVIATVGPRLFAVSGRTGRILWRTHLKNEIRGESAVSDLDGDSVSDITFCTVDGRIVTFSGLTGRELASHPISPASGSAYALADLDGDGKTDIVVASVSGTVQAVSARTGNSLWKFASDGELRDPPAFADLDRDGISDVIFGDLDKKIHALSGRTGRPLWIRAHGAQVWLTPTVADLNGDGQPDVVVASGITAVVALSGKDGSPLWTYSMQESPIGVSLTYVDGDAIPDLVTMTASGNMHLISGRSGLRLSLVHCSSAAADFPPILVDPTESWTDRVVTWRTAHQGPASTLSRPDPRRFTMVTVYFGNTVMAKELQWSSRPHGTPTPLGFTQGRSALAK